MWQVRKKQRKMVDIYMLLTVQENYPNEELKQVSPRITILLLFVIEHFLKSNIINIQQIIVKKEKKNFF